MIFYSGFKKNPVVRLGFIYNLIYTIDIYNIDNLSWGTFSYSKYSLIISRLEKEKAAITTSYLNIHFIIKLESI